MFLAITLVLIEFCLEPTGACYSALAIAEGPADAAVDYQERVFIGRYLPDALCGVEALCVDVAALLSCQLHDSSLVFGHQ